MIFNLSEGNSIANKFTAELRDVTIQKDRMRFRNNMRRLGKILAFEISKTFSFEEKNVETPLGIAKVSLPTEHVVLATILRAGLPMHEGMLEIFDDASNAFISAFRKHHKDGTFDINFGYISCPNIEGTTLILSDPMIATGASITKSIQHLLEHGQPTAIHVAALIASSEGIDRVRRLYPKVNIWVGAIDEELTAKSYIVPGLGDAGDLAFGIKLQK